MQTERIVLNEERNVTLTAYIQQVGGEFRGVAKRPAALVLPGGGYQFCSDREADPVALCYLQAGYQAFVLRYSVKEHARWPNPLDDYEQAMALIRSKSEEWGLYPDKIAVIGFSAGGHLAAAAATMAENRPNAAILGYAVAGEDVKMCLKTAPDTISAVDQDTCACFLFATRTDNVVPIANSLDFMKALNEHGISFESHIYAYGPHGFSICDSSLQDVRETTICRRAPQWVSDSIGWLRDVLGDFGEEGMTQPLCPARVNLDGEAFLSVDCTLGRIMGNPEGSALLAPIMAAAQRKVSAGGTAVESMGGDMAAMINKMKLRDALSYANLPEVMIEELDRKLRKIPNI